MSFKAILYAYVLGGITFIPLLVIGAIFFSIYTSVPVGDADVDKKAKAKLQSSNGEDGKEGEEQEKDKGTTTATTTTSTTASSSSTTLPLQDHPTTRKGWLIVRRTFEETPSTDGGYVNMMRSLLDSTRSRGNGTGERRPKDTWFVVLKGKVLYLYEDEAMSECEAAIELGGHEVVVYPEGQLDGELFAKRNAICLKPRVPPETRPSVTREMGIEKVVDPDEAVDELNNQQHTAGAGGKGEKKKRARELEKLLEAERTREAAQAEALDVRTPWFIFVKSNVEMEDWYLALIHASDHPANYPTLQPLEPVYHADDMQHLIATLDEAPDVIPMRWLNALLGRLFFSMYRTEMLEAYIIGRLMKKLSKVKRPAFLTDIVVTEVSVGDTAPMLSKPMLKELTREGDAAIEVRLQYKGEVRITVEATATINLSARFKSYTVKLVLAAVLRELDGNLLIKVKRPPSNRIWYAFTQPPKMVLDVEPIVSDRQITWGMILNQIESRLKEIIQESIVMPNMDDIAFFPSAHYAHRGGIWADAVRNERSARSPEPSPTQANKNEGLATLASTSEPDISTSPPMAPGDIPHSHSADEVQAQSTSSSPPPPSHTEQSKSAARQGAEGSGETTPSSTSTPVSLKRRTWFSSTADDGPSVVEEASVTGAQPSLFDDRRGRAAELDPASSQRSRSTPSRGTESESITPRESPDNGVLLSPIRIPSLSDRTRSRSSSSSSFVDQDNGDSSFNDASSVTSHKSFRSNVSSGGQAEQQPSSPSFLATLKSRAAATDKQALQATAKETLRNWGAKWNSLKNKDRDNNHVNHDRASPLPPPSSSQQQQQVHDVPDVGPSDMRTDSHKQRSYAEMRAAVEERKQRDRLISTPAPVSGSSESRPDPVPISNGGRANGLQGRTISMTSPATSFLGGLSSSPGASFVKPPPSSQLGAETGVVNKLVPPAISRTPTTSMTIDDHDRDHLPAQAPIRSQPTAPRTMTIPGIHASHRGEVMSMGNVAPPPQVQSTSPGGMPSVYRLFRSPTLHPQQGNNSDVQPAAVDANASNGNDSMGEQTETNESSSSTSTVPSMSLSPQSQPPASSKPVPPPLPPRKQSNLDSGATTIHGGDGGNGAVMESRASEALKNIVSRDRRTSWRVSQDLSSTPQFTADGPQSDEVSEASSSSKAPSVSAAPTIAAPTPTAAAVAPSRVGPPLPPRKVTPASPPPS